MKYIGENDKSVKLRRRNEVYEDASLNENHRIRHRLDNVPIGMQVRTLDFVNEEKLILDYFNINKMFRTAAKSIIESKRGFKITQDMTNKSTFLMSMKILKTQNALDSIEEIRLQLTSKYILEKLSRDIPKLLKLFDNLKNVEIDNTAFSSPAGGSASVLFDNARLILENHKNIFLVRWAVGNKQKIVVMQKKTSEENTFQLEIGKNGVLVRVTTYTKYELKSKLTKKLFFMKNILLYLIKS